ncbi:hypothetical protein DF182_26760 [Chitinophaga flava]|uniref:PqqD family protein n=2 Tax=Chitinophaga flava TaxID=2259036 RepID=A0A365XUN0_9BACT|nr:hypothetical protein DF182_26760 [Chitinophaga flava]
MKFNFFKSSKPVIPVFEALQTSPHKDFYFYRKARWYWLNNDMITIIDSHSPRMITLDPWPQMVFLGATGRLMVSEYINFVASKYKQKIPADLDVTILLMIDKLVAEKLISLSAVQTEPDPQHNLPLK